MIRKSHAKRSLRVESLQQRRMTAAAPMPIDLVAPTDPPAEMFTLPSQPDSVSQFRLQSQTRVQGLLTAEFNQSEVREDNSGSLTLTIARNPQDVSRDLIIRIRGGNPSQLKIPVSVTIPQGESKISIRLSPVNDSLAEAPATLSYTFTAAGHTGTSAQIELVDDEAPRFQNAESPYDVNADGHVTALDALQVINSIRPDRSGEVDTTTEASSNHYPDVNGDYQITAIDALQVINALGLSHRG